MSIVKGKNMNRLDTWMRNRDKAEVNTVIGIAAGVVAMLMAVLILVPLGLEKHIDGTYGSCIAILTLILFATATVCAYKDMGEFEDTEL